jgi:hypothetical protein
VKGGDKRINAMFVLRREKKGAYKPCFPGVPLPEKKTLCYKNLFENSLYLLKK